MKRFALIVLAALVLLVVVAPGAGAARKRSVSVSSGEASISVYLTEGYTVMAMQAIGNSRDHAVPRCFASLTSAGGGTVMAMLADDHRRVTQGSWHPAGTYTLFIRARNCGGYVSLTRPRVSERPYTTPPPKH